MLVTLTLLQAVYLPGGDQAMPGGSTITLPETPAAELVAAGLAKVAPPAPPANTTPPEA